MAWNCKYVLERAASGGIISGKTSGEGLVCKFTGPGILRTSFVSVESFSKKFGLPLGFMKFWSDDTTLLKGGRFRRDEVDDVVEKPCFMTPSINST